MKKTLCSVICYTILTTILSTTFVSAELVSNITSSTSTTEEKFTCTATINDDFVNDEIIVVLNNESSRALHDYTTLDFSEIQAISVENITKYTTEALSVQRKKGNINQLNDYNNSVSTDDEVVINENDFYQVWLIKLNKKSKSNVLKSVKILEQRNDIVSVSPNYYHYKDEIDYTLESNTSELSATFDEKTLLIAIM